MHAPVGKTKAMSWKNPSLGKVVLWVLVIVLISPLFVLPILAFQIRAEEKLCTRTKTEETVATSAPNERKSSKARNDRKNQPKRAARLNLADEQDTVLAFGRGLETKRLDVWFDVTGEIQQSQKRMNLNVAEFKRSDDARIGTEFLHANARLIGRQVRLRVCMQRTDYTTADPGTYVGRITFLDRRVEPYTVPLTITLAYPVWPWPTLILYLVILIAIPYVWGLKHALEDVTEVLGRGSWTDFKKWVRSWGGIRSVGVGIAAAVAAFTATYLASPDWGSGITQILGLIGATFTAFVTAATVTAAASK